MADSAFLDFVQNTHELFTYTASSIAYWMLMIAFAAVCCVVVGLRYFYIWAFTAFLVAVLFAPATGAAFHPLIHKLTMARCEGLFRKGSCDAFIGSAVACLYIAMFVQPTLWVVLVWHYEYEWTDGYWRSVTGCAGIMGISALVGAALSLLSAIVWKGFGLNADQPAKEAAD